MGFKSSSFAMARTTRFKRTLSRNWHGSRNAFFTPPATPFNNTSFLIHLQQNRQHHQHGSSAPAAFDQYGSMQTYMSVIACCNDPSASSSHSTTTSSTDQLQAPISESPWTSQITTDSEPKFSDPDGPHMCGSGPREMNSCSDGGARPVLVRSPKLEGDEREDEQRHFASRCFMDDNVATQCAEHLGSHNGTFKEIA